MLPVQESINELLVERLMIIAQFFGFVAFITVLYPMQSMADEIYLDNGIRITGTVSGSTEAHVLVNSDYAEQMKVNRQRIIGITTDAPLTIRMKSGEVLKGNLRHGGDGVSTVMEVHGREIAVIDITNIAVINPQTENQWKWTVNMAGNLQTGNTERNSLVFDTEATRKSDKDRFSIRFLYSIGYENGVMSSRNAYSTLKYDYFYSKQFYEYLGIELLNDAFKNIKLRTVVGPGIGYQFWDDPNKSLSFEAGISYFSEDMKAEADDSWFSGRCAVNYRHRIFKTMTFTENLLLYPGISDSGDFTIRNEVSLATSLGSSWSLRLTNILDFDNVPALETKKTDSRSMLGLQYSY